MEAISVGIGSVFEQAIRYLLLMYTVDEPLSEDRINCLDFITTYAADFGIGSSNLHGNSGYRFGEFTSRALTANKALLELAQRGLIHIKPTSQGCFYAITDNGNDFINSLDSSYVSLYAEIADRVDYRFKDKPTRNLHRMITRRIQDSVKDIKL